MRIPVCVPAPQLCQCPHTMATTVRHLPSLARQASRYATRSMSSSAMFTKFTLDSSSLPMWLSRRKTHTRPVAAAGFVGQRGMQDAAACVTPCETGCPEPPVHNHHACWNCHLERKRTQCAPSLFCEGCGVMLPIPRGTNFFSLMGVENESYTIDVKALDSHYKKMMAKMHPDKFMQKSQTEQELSATQCSQVNAAYTTLRCPHKRAVYMLRRLGFDFEEQTSATDPEFMMEIMEASSEIMEADGDQEAIKRVRYEFYEPQMEQNCREAAEAFARQDVHVAAEVTARLQYLKRLGSMITEKQEVM